MVDICDDLQVTTPVPWDTIAPTISATGPAGSNAAPPAQNCSAAPAPPAPSAPKFSSHTTAVEEKCYKPLDLRPQGSMKVPAGSIKTTTSSVTAPTGSLKAASETVSSPTVSMKPQPVSTPLQSTPPIPGTNPSLMTTLGGRSLGLRQALQAECSTSTVPLSLVQAATPLPGSQPPGLSLAPEAIPLTARVSMFHVSLLNLGPGHQVEAQTLQQFYQVQYNFFF